MTSEAFLQKIFFLSVEIGFKQNQYIGKLRFIIWKGCFSISFFINFVFVSYVYSLKCESMLKTVEQNSIGY